MAGRARGAYLSCMHPQAMARAADVAHLDPERRLRRLLRRLPSRMQALTRRLRKPASKWARIPAGVLLIVGGCFAILPIFGLWMLPLGFILLAEDIPPLRRQRDLALDWLERRRPHWFLAAGRLGAAGERAQFAGLAGRRRRPMARPPSHVPDRGEHARLQVKEEVAVERPPPRV
jgi:hypothetical protein